MHIGTNMIAQTIERMIERTRAVAHARVAPPAAR